MYDFKCSNRKKHHSCSKESIRKADLEEMVLNTTLMLLNTPENLSVIAEEVIEVHRKRAREQAVLTLLRDERSKAQKALNNLMKALEAGIFTATTKDRITELELQIDELNGRILSEECKEANLLSRRNLTRDPSGFLFAYGEGFVRNVPTYHLFCRLRDIKKNQPNRLVRLVLLWWKRGGSNP